ncbi:hypothetical protein [Mycobacterium virginiense]|uniref:hypothetical protein n=1 Tax=Mycolicibacter virginiensis TaxID=1795032 RepID=UPI00197C1544
MAATTAVAPLPAQPALHSHAVQLTASWDDVLQTAEANATDIWNHFSAAPFAGLQQQLANQIGYIQGLADGSLSFADVTKDIQDHLTALFGAPATEDTAAVPGALFGPFLPEGGATDTLYQSLDDVVKATDGLLAVRWHLTWGIVTASEVSACLCQSIWGTARSLDSVCAATVAAWPQVTRPGGPGHTPNRPAHRSDTSDSRSRRPKAGTRRRPNQPLPSPSVPASTTARHPASRQRL